MLVPAPLTLLAGGPELAPLIGQLVDPPEVCSVVGPEAVLDGTDVPIDSVVTVASPPSGRPGPERGDLVAGITRALRRSRATGRVLVVLAEEDDVAAAAFTVLSSKPLAGLVKLDAIVVTVDGVRLATRLASGWPVGTDTELDRLAIADRVVVARSGDITAPALGAIGHVLRSINRTGPIIAPAIAPCSLDDLLDVDAWSGTPTVGRAPDQPSPFLDPDVPEVVVCAADGPLDPQALERWIDGVLADHAPDLLRLQGSVEVADERNRIHLQGVRSYLVRSLQPTDARASAGRSSLVALIGRRLPVAALQEGFANAAR